MGKTSDSDGMFNLEVRPGTRLSPIVCGTVTWKGVSTI